LSRIPPPTGVPKIGDLDPLLVIKVIASIHVALAKSSIWLTLSPIGTVHVSTVPFKVPATVEYFFWFLSPSKNCKY